MKNPLMRFSSFLERLGRSRRKTNNKHIFSQGENSPFQKRKKRVFLSFLRKFDIHISKKHTFFYALGTMVFIVFGLSLAIFGPYLQVNRIEIIRDSSQIDINMAYSSVDNLRGKKIYSLDTQKIAESLIRFQNNIEIVKIDVIFPNRVDIRLRSSESIFETKLNDKIYTVTKNGTLIPSVASKKLKSIFLYNNSIPENKSLDYQKILSEKYLKNIEILLSSIQENMLGIQISSIHYFVAEREVLIEIQRGSYLIFDISKDPKTQIEKLAIFNKEKGNIQDAGYIYVDTRIVNKIFICSSENEFDCRKNLGSIYGIIKKKA